MIPGPEKLSQGVNHLDLISARCPLPRSSLPTYQWSVAILPTQHCWTSRALRLSSLYSSTARGQTAWGQNQRNQDSGIWGWKCLGLKEKYDLPCYPAPFAPPLVFSQGTPHIAGCPPLSSFLADPISCHSSGTANPGSPAPVQPLPRPETMDQDRLEMVLSSPSPVICSEVGKC